MCLFLAKMMEIFGGFDATHCWCNARDTKTM